MTESRRASMSGIWLALGAYLIWGVLPAFFKLLHTVHPAEIVAQRVLWSAVFLGIVILCARRRDRLMAVLRNPRALGLLLITAILIAINWLVYVWAVLNHHVLESSLGYFLNPLVNVALGMLVLREGLSRVHALAVGLAAIGVAVLAWGAGSGLWISLSLAFSFSLYGLLRKIVSAEALEGLMVETLILAPVAVAWLLWMRHAGLPVSFGASTGLTSLLMIGGVLTAIPLLLFAAAARRMLYVELGLWQYVAPTLQFLLGVFAYGEHMTTAHIICFVFIWGGLGLFAASSLEEARRARTLNVQGAPV